MIFIFETAAREQGLELERLFALGKPGILIVPGVGDVVTERRVPRMEQTQIDRLVEQNVTLDGKPARIIGRLLEFAIVAEPGNGPSIEFTWPTVQHIVDKGGKFKSH